MASREFSVIEIKDILRRWAAGEGIKSVARATGASRNAVRRHVRAAQVHGLRRGDVAGAVEDELLIKVVGDLQPGTRPAGAAMKACEQHRDKILRWKKECDAPKIRELLLRQNVDVPRRTLQRFLHDEAGSRASRDTVRLPDPDPGVLEFDFLELGTFVDRETDEEVEVSAALLTAAVSRHQFLWPCLTQTRDDVIDALEAAWLFFDGVYTSYDQLMQTAPYESHLVELRYDLERTSSNQPHRLRSVLTRGHQTRSSAPIPLATLGITP